MATTGQTNVARAEWAKYSLGRKILSFSTNNRLNMVAITDTRDGCFVNSIVSPVIIVLDLSYLPLSYYLGMQVQPYLDGIVQRHLKNSIFDLNNPSNVKALKYIVHEVFNAVQLILSNEDAQTECNFDDLLGVQSGGSKDVDGEDNGRPQVNPQKRKRINKKIDRAMW
jgi:hypothetical protein